MIRKIVLIILILFHKSSYAQKKFSIGTYFVPSYMFFAYAPQNININLHSGISIERNISLRTSIIANISYFKSSQTYIHICKDCSIILEKHKNKFLEFSLGTRYDIFPFKPWNFKPHAVLGLIGNFNFDSHAEYTDSLGQITSDHYKELNYHFIYGYVGLSLEHSITERTKLHIDPVVRFPAGLGNWIGVPVISYTALVGLGIGINIKL